ncbi:amphoterin-induced protein 1 [Eublepharis macularius]|uniref:Amphoterin-induced protein 1 n=1 Tax=Eublepharis macularius TaxID=481883 RepID=A0AA97JD15_EUBMA|nr:amphoterin-induced protein 1 [Eublepharis macularius]
MWFQDASVPRRSLAPGLGGSALLLLLLLLLSLGIARRGGLALSCPKDCMCASNIISCSNADLKLLPLHLPPYVAVLDLSHNNLTQVKAEWAPSQLPHLHSLLLNHNRLSFISVEAFNNLPHLKYLDLSSNSIASLGENLFSKLKELEVLLLYNNKISKIDHTAFEEMASLQKLYLSHNVISRFPLELIKKDGALLPELALLDLSGNKIKNFPVDDVKDLPAWVKNGLYVHRNPLMCSCNLYSLFSHWQKRQLSSAVDFEEELRCDKDLSRKGIKILSLSNPEIMNCTEVKEQLFIAYRGENVTINCDTRQRGVTIREWVTPRFERVPQENNNSSMLVLTNGSLQISNIGVEDMGPYTCYAVSQVFNETLYVHVTVHNFTQHGASDTLNTAYTTLVGCILSVILVLIYLYLTPCRCWCRSNEKQANQQEDSINSSMLSTTPNHNVEVARGKEGLNRHTMSSNAQGQNGKCKSNSSPKQVAKGAKKEERKMSDPDSVSSVFSDTPIVGISQSEGGRGCSRDKAGAELVGLL